MGFSQTRAWTRVPCIGRWILNHCTTREVPYSFLIMFVLSFWIRDDALVSRKRNLTQIGLNKILNLLPPVSRKVQRLQGHVWLGGSHNVERTLWFPLHFFALVPGDSSILPRDSPLLVPKWCPRTPRLHASAFTSRGKCLCLSTKILTFPFFDWTDLGYMPICEVVTGAKGMKFTHWLSLDHMPYLLEIKAESAFSKLHGCPTERAAEKEGFMWEDNWGKDYIFKYQDHCFW